MSPEQVVARVLDVSPNEISDGTSNDEVSTWDSMTHVNLILELESEYGISLSADEAMDMTDVASIKETLRQYGVRC